MNLVLFTIFACLVPLVLFVGHYATLRWWTNPAGQSVMVLSASGLLSFVLILIRNLGHVAPEWLRISSYGIIAGALWWQYITFLRIRSRARKRAQEQVQRELQPEH